jgi:AhpD family alkylhydroperoxidase
MTTLGEGERELAAVGAAIAAGCQPCTRYHVQAAIKSGLSPDQVNRAIDDAQAVRDEGALVVANLGRRLLGTEERPSHWDGSPTDRENALTYIGAAAGCNAGSLLTPVLEQAQARGLSPDEVRSALEIAETVKQHAGEFLRRDARRVVEETPASASESAWAAGCCGPVDAASASESRQEKEGAVSCC